MFNRISQSLMNTPLAEGIPMGKSPLVRGDYFKFLLLIELRFLAKRYLQGRVIFLTENTSLDWH